MLTRTGVFFTYFSFMRILKRLTHAARAIFHKQLIHRARVQADPPRLPLIPDNGAPDDLADGDTENRRSA